MCLEIVQEGRISIKIKERGVEGLKYKTSLPPPPFRDYFIPPLQWGKKVDKKKKKKKTIQETFILLEKQFYVTSERKKNGGARGGKINTIQIPNT